MHNNVFNCFYSDFGPSALQLRMEELVVIFATYDIRWYGEDLREHPIKMQCFDRCLLWILSLQRKSKTMKKISTAALVSLDYKISVPPYHTLQHAADLVFHQHWKGRNSGKSPTLNIMFSQETENKKKKTPKTNSFTYVRLSKNVVGKIADFGLQFSFNYRLTYSASELSGFSCTSSLTMNKKFQYRMSLRSAILKFLIHC